IALYLDGLDEMPVALRSRALEILRAEWEFRITITSRATEYTDVGPAGLDGFTSLHLLPVDPAAAGRYLAESHRGLRRRAWEVVAARMAEDPGQPLGRALGSPLMLHLARYAEPSDLLAERFDTPEWVEQIGRAHV